MFTDVVTLVTLAILWGRFEAVFLTTEAPGIGAEVGGQRAEGSVQKMFSREGCFQA